MAAKDISSFFKRKADDAVSPAKAAKVADPADEHVASVVSAAGGDDVTDAQLQRAEANKKEAALKRAAATGVPVFATMGPQWVALLKAEFEKPYYKELMRFLEAEQAAKATVYPPAPLVCSWATACAPQDVRVVIVGQDPYHGPGQAHGLCFSVQKGVAVPPSLGNMFKELATDIPGFRRPPHGCLTSWAQQGVLLLNAVLTVRKGEPNSHKDKGWEKLTDAVIDDLNRTRKDIVFILWGAYAQKKGARVDKKKHCVLAGTHPSPLSATKFFGCKHFSKTNAYLTSKGYKPINWDSLADAA